MYRSTFLCFVELVVRGGLALLISAVQEISSFINTTLAAIRTNIQSDVAAANSVIQAAVSGINKVTSLVDVNLSVPQFSIPSLNALANVTIPTDFENALISLNSSLPSVDDFKAQLDAIIDTPFQDVIADINSTFSSIRFNSSVFAVPPQSNLVFCDQMDTSFVDDLGNDLVKFARIGAGIIVVAAILLTLANMAFMWWRWRKSQEHLEYIREAWSSDPNATRAPKGTLAAAEPPTMTMTNHNLRIFLNDSESPLISRLVDQFCARLHFSQRTNTAVRFFFSYTTYPPALVCFLIGFIGLLSVEIQLAAIHPLEQHYNSQVNSAVSNFSTSIATQLNANMANQSATYANSVNAQILAVQNTINDGVFGWVNSTTTTLNNTIVAFYNEIQDAVNATFGGTILDSPAQEFVKCLIGSKVDSLEEALTFLHNNLQVNLPTMNNTVLMLNNDTVNEITAPIATAALGSQNNTPSNASSTSSSSEGLVQKLITRYISALKRERTVYLIFIGIWIFVALCAIGIILWNFYGQPAMREWKRKRYLARSGGDASSGLPYLSGDARRANTSSIWRSRRPDTAATPWLPPNETYDEKAGMGVRNGTRASFLRDAAVADAYVSSASSNDDHSHSSPYNNSSTYPSRTQITVTDVDPDYSYNSSHQVLEPPTTADILRDFTPLQTPRTQAARNLQHEQDSAIRETTPRRLTVDSFMNYPSGSAENGAGNDDGKSRKSNWFGGVAWGAVSGKLKNDARRTTMRDPHAFDHRFGKDAETSSQPHSQFDHSPSPDTSSNDWFSKLAFWRQPREAEAVLPQTMYVPSNEKRNVIKLDSPPQSYQNHQSLIVPHSTYESSQNFNLAPPPPPRMAVRPPPAVAQTRGEDFPRSVESQDGMLGFNASVPRSATPVSSDVAVDFRGVDESLAYRDNQVMLPIHHQFVAHDMSPNSSSQSMDPFGDEYQRPRPARASFGSSGLQATNNASSRTLMPQQNGGMGHSRNQSISYSQPRAAHHRRISSVPNADPFSTPFDDPQSPQRYHNHAGFGAPATPSAFSTGSGPRAF